MQKCPPEIHAYIFELACTDGGAAGVALSAVSHYVRAMSAPYQWCTLAVTGTPQTVRLAERIRSSFASPSSSPPLGTGTGTDAVKGKGRAQLSGPPISHLFVSNRSASQARELRYAKMVATSDMAGRQRIEATFDAEADAWACAVRALFAYAAPTLRTLAMMCYDIHVSPNGRLFFSDLKRYRFPLLEELSIRGGFDTRLRDYDGAVSTTTLRQRGAQGGGGGEGGGAMAGAWARGLAEYSEEDDDEPTLPALRRLHLASPISFDLFLHRLSPLAPLLSHVRLSELLAFDYDMVHALHSELSERGIVPAQFPRLNEQQWNAEPRAVPVDWDRFLPPPGTLRRLVVQPAQLPPPPEQLCGCCSGYYRVDDMTRLLREMAREARSRHAPVGEVGEGDADVDVDAVFVFLPPGPRHNAYSFEEGYRDWLGRAAGGRGCWKEHDEVDIDAKPFAPAVVATEEGGMRLWNIGVKRSISRNWL
ncbi:hypothetical protein DFH94DRAFT_479753 [Russula ochroleuca]|jgi:hypothetical protein|uniref:Uncharacterized protein n=1 Tax=Russula ochroleuca TaxID=152965 RepID=A0A9P5MWJ9_9AGAM|nr:hypothetical protein DFH94DRAFT_479753 [Russula ochroleuca]